MIEPVGEKSIAREGGGEEVVDGFEIGFFSVLEVVEVKTGNVLPLVHELRVG